MEKSAHFLERSASSTQSAAPAAEKQRPVATLRDLRPEVPTVEPASQGGIDVLAAVRKRPFITLVILVACFLGGAQYVLRHTPREYHAEAQIYVSPTYFKNLQQDREQLQISYSTLVNQQILTIRRFEILREALGRLEQQGIQWRNPGESDEASVGRLAAALDIKYIADSYEVVVGLGGPTAERLAPILNTITQTYLEKQKQEEISDRSSRLAALSAEQGSVAATLQQKQDLQTVYSQKLTTLNLDKASTADDAALNGARQALEDAHRKRVEAETQLAILEGPLPAAKDPGGIPGGSLLRSLAEDAANNDPNSRPLINSYVQRTLDLQKSMEGLTSDHPLRQSAEKEVTRIQDQLKHLQGSLADEASARMLGKARSDVSRARLLETQLSREVEEYTAKVQGVAKQVQLAQGVNDEIDRLRRQQAAINGQIDALKMPGDSAGYLRIFSAARTPLAPNKSNSNKLLFMVLAGALFLGVGTAVALDLFDQRIFSPAEVKRALGFPPVGLVLESTHGTSAFCEEHFRRLVNGIQRGVAAQNARSIVLTPLRHARTPRSLIADIGRVLVARGLKTAIVDANPNLAADEIVQRTGPIQRLALSGARLPEIADDDPSLPVRIEMGSSQEISAAPLISRISSMLDMLEKEYDVVLIDAPPLGLSADTEFLATISDITLLVAEAGEATRTELIRGANVLGRIGAPSVGVIMTQVRLGKAGGALKRDLKRFRALAWSAVPDTAGV
jgi:succinoglycan biosynthesis transport protein ExoP